MKILKIIEGNIFRAFVPELVYLVKAKANFGNKNRFNSTRF